MNVCIFLLMFGVWCKLCRLIIFSLLIDSISHHQKIYCASFVVTYCASLLIKTSNSCFVATPAQLSSAHNGCLQHFGGSLLHHALHDLLHTQTRLASSKLAIV